MLDYWSEHFWEVPWIMRSGIESGYAHFSFLLFLPIFMAHLYSGLPWAIGLFAIVLGAKYTKFYISLFLTGQLDAYREGPASLKEIGHHRLQFTSKRHLRKLSKEYDGL